ncbi:Bacterio-opsin activator HTH domain protein [Vulcanisaeta moutnovskia 768-28]|uniref:Bacterio-opsin activator HTH domain protein n=1 Tax=Vulcanisaeta moutnovskia (strain 768-28) TaxID=985053 RepID=F0QYL6_VULM7|nr:helix-turn-helix domain-containing protein [Vulcanisaeta moutnovskia]ADY01449.1 Bacterio-opsin activator HTH domain protein [Vulcanisaeta moutnovskia 768-28]
MKLVRLYVRIEHFDDWSYYTKDYEGLMTVMQYYYPYRERGYSFEVISVGSRKNDVIKSFIRRFRNLKNIIDVVSVNKLNNRNYEITFLGDINGMLKYLILEQGGIVVSSYVKDGVKDFTAYFFTKDYEYSSAMFKDLYDKFNNYGRIITFNVSKVPRSVKSVIFTSPMYELTDIERKILLKAYHDGFFNYPRSTNLNNLAKEFNMSKATVNIHLRNALKKIISTYVNNART